ncbi:MAG TPA: ion channel [Sphingomonas sp.]
MSRHPRRKRMTIGGFDAVKLGVPSSFADLYYSLMEIGWPSFVAVVAAAFLLINLAFGLVYAALPGAIINATPGSIADGFFFSVETLGTVGYGNMAPATRLCHAIAAAEILAGLFFSATMTGLIFARFARPRDSLLFSKVAVIGRYEGRRALMVRLATARARPLAEATGQISWLENLDTPDGRTMRRLVDLPLVRARNPMLGLAWTLTHVIDEDSPMFRALCAGEGFQLFVTVSGLDTLLASQTVSGHAYRHGTILIDHEFDDIIVDRDGLVHLDLTRLHSVSPIATVGLSVMPQGM